MSLLSTINRLAVRRFGATLFVIGGAGVLEWAKVFGDGGSVFQLVAGIVGLVLGVWIVARSSTMRWPDSDDR